MMKKIIVLVLMFTYMLNPSVLLAETDGEGSVLEQYENLNETDQVDSQPAETEQEAPQSVMPESEDEGESLWLIAGRVILALLLIVALVYGLLKLIQKFSAPQKHTNQLENMGGIPLGSNKSIQMIRVGGKIYMVGVANTIELLTEVTDPGVIASFQERQPSNESMSSFVEYFKSSFNKNAASTTERKSQPKEDRAFASLFKGELETMKQKQADLRNSIKKDDRHE